MSAKLGELVVEISANMARFQSDMGKAQHIANANMRRVADDVNRSTSAIQNSLSLVGKSVIAGFSVTAVAVFAKEIVQAGLAVEKLQMQFKASAGSAESAAREIEYIRGVTNRLGLDFQTTATAYGKWLASTRNTAIEGAQAQKVFEGVSKAVTALGLSSDEANGIFLALGQMMSKGKVSAEELTGQLGERLPGALKLAADSLGLTTAELMDQMQQGKVMSSELLPKLAEQLEKTYGVAAEEASKKGQAGINRFNNEVKETASAIGSILNPMIDAATNKAADLLKIMRETNGSKTFINDKFALPEDAAFVQRNRGGKDGLDPQMARVMADRRAAQETINAQRAAADKAAAAEKEASKAREKAAKLAATAIREAAAQQRQWNDTYASLRREIEILNPALSEHDRQVLAVTQRYDDLRSRKGADTARLDALQAEHLKEINSLAEINRLLETRKILESEIEAAAAERSLGLAGQSFLQAPQAGGTLGTAPGTKIGIDGGMPKFSLNGAAETAGFMGNATSPAITIAEQEAKQLQEIEKRHHDIVLGMKLDAASQALSIMQQAAGDNKALAVAALVAQKALAVAQIMINTEVAASAALAPPPLGLGPVAGMALAAQVRAMGYVSMGLTVASGIMEAGQTLSGKRERGGPVRAGETYLVGERGPELMTAGANGYVTPNHALGGMTYAPTIQIDARNSTLSAAEIEAIVERANRRAQAEIKRSMDRGGTFALSSGRMK